ncbi:hypothetical protein K2X83_02555 [Patescibacteria group bacterium]|nr:hypothetical protein [Patescibacteria group bacterium]
MKTIGFIGQGYVGKNYADDFEQRGYPVVRYSLEEPYIQNKNRIQECDVVFIAVPTPTTPNGFNLAIVEEALSLPKDGTIVVIKSTILPGSTELLQKKFPRLTLIFSPEFLREATAAYDVSHPHSNVIGLATDSVEHTHAGQFLLSILPKAPSEILCTSTEAELIKYAQNVSGYVDIIVFNIFYDLAQKIGARWEPVLKAMQADPNIPSRFANPIHKSGRGAGGHCLIKDMAALRALNETLGHDSLGVRFLEAAEEKNKQLLSESGKDVELLRGVYGNIDTKPQQ